MKFHPEIMGRPRYFVFTENILEHIFKKFLTDGKKTVLHCATNKKDLYLKSTPTLNPMSNRFKPLSLLKVSK